MCINTCIHFQIADFVLYFVSDSVTVGVYVLLRAANVFGCGYLVNLVRPAHRKIPMTHQKALWYSGKTLLFVSVYTYCFHFLDKK